MSKIQKSNKVGRPKVDTSPITVRAHTDVIGALDDYRRDQDDLPTRPEAIRRILTDWLRERGYLARD